MDNLEKAIDNLYLTFSRYKSTDIFYCECGCIDEEDVIKLSSKPLRELYDTDLTSYHGSAIDTWGSVEHYKHFLPRICELISINRGSNLLSLDELHAKLAYANWKNWPEEEQLAIKKYIVADWIDFANNHQSVIREKELESYCNFLELQDLLNHWHFESSPIALRNFVQFFYHHGNQILSRGIKLNNVKHKEAFSCLVQSNKLINRLEMEFFTQERIEIDYAQKVSTVLQMIEQQLKIDKAADSSFGRIQ